MDNKEHGDISTNSLVSQSVSVSVSIYNQSQSMKPKVDNSPPQNANCENSGSLTSSGEGVFPIQHEKLFVPKYASNIQVLIPIW